MLTISNKSTILKNVKNKCSITKGGNIMDKSREEKEFIEKLGKLNEENLTYLLLVAQALFAEEKKGDFYSPD